MGCCNPHKLDNDQFEFLTYKPISQFNKEDQETIDKIIKIQSHIKGMKIRNQMKKENLEGNNIIDSERANTNVNNKYYKEEGKAQITDEDYEELLKNYPPLTDGIKTVIVKDKICDDNCLYYGEFNEETKERHGRGIQVWPDGSIYYGYFVNGKANIRGRLVHSDGDSYEGEWKDDKADGKGTYKHMNGAEYVGDWVDDRQNGNGVETWPDGSRYMGEYKNGKKNGKGVFKWADNSYYEGEFLDNNIHGKGTYVWSDKRKYIGDWVNNKMEGSGVFLWPDKRRYEGQYHNDKKEGFGSFFWPDGRVFRGNWKNGRQDGQGEFISADNGGSRKGIWKEGKRVKWL